MGEIRRYIKLSKVARKLEIGTSTIVDILNRSGYDINNNPNFKLTKKQVKILINELATQISVSSLFSKDEVLTSVYYEKPKIKGYLSIDIEQYIEANRDVICTYFQNTSETENPTQQYIVEAVESILWRCIKEKYSIKCKLFDIKHHFFEIITNTLFHIFYSEDDDYRITSSNFGVLL